MAIILCQECGNQVSDRAASCPHCGCPINQLANNPNDDENKLENLITIARRARKSGDAINAKKCYEQIAYKTPNHWEGIFYSVYYSALECKIANISTAAVSVSNSIYNTFSAIADLPDDTEKMDSLADVINSADVIARVFADNSIRHYEQFKSLSDERKNLSNRLYNVEMIYTSLESNFKLFFPSFNELLVSLQKLYNLFLKKHADTSWIGLGTTRERLIKEIALGCPEYAHKLQQKEEIDKTLKQKEKELNNLKERIEQLESITNSLGYGLLKFGVKYMLFMAALSFILFVFNPIVGSIMLIGFLVGAAICYVIQNKKGPTEDQEAEKELLIQKRNALKKEWDSLQAQLNSLNL